jgi:hypothetical protein
MSDDDAVHELGLEEGKVDLAHLHRHDIEAPRTDRANADRVRADEPPIDESRPSDGG